MQGTITKVTPGTANNGNKFISIFIEDSDGEKYIYSVFDAELMKAAKMLNGEDVHWEDEENPKNAKYPKLISLEASDGNSPKAKAKPTTAKFHSQGNGGYDNNNDRERRITELANLKSACMLVGNMCSGVMAKGATVEEYTEGAMKAGHLAIMVSGLFNSHINRTPPTATTSGSLLEEEAPAPKPKKAKSKKTLFVAALIAAGYDVNDTEQMNGVAVWLEDNYGCNEFKDLTEEAQDKAIAAIQAGASDSDE